MICKNCKAELPDDTKFCNFCGTPVTDADTAPAPKITCKNCGASLSADATFCNFCGAAVETDISFSPVQSNQESSYTVVSEAAASAASFSATQENQPASYSVVSTEPASPVSGSASILEMAMNTSSEGTPEKSEQPKKRKKLKGKGIGKSKKAGKAEEADDHMPPEVASAAPSDSSPESVDIPSAEPTDIEEESSEPGLTPEAAQKQADEDAASKGTKPRTVGLIALIEVIILAAAVFVFYQFRTDTIRSITAETLSINSISVTVASRNGQDLEIVCSTAAGEVERLPVTDSVAVFTDLEPNTSYTFEPASLKGKLLLSNTSATAKTNQETSLDGIAVTSYSATSASFSISGTGPVPDTWLVTLTAVDGTVISETVDGTEFTFDNLTPQTTYTVTVERGDGEPLSGANTCDFTTQGYTVLSDFVRTGIGSDSISLAWSYSGTIPDSWTISCSAADGSSTEVDATGTEYTLTGLESGKIYTITLSCGSMEPSDAATISVLLPGENIFTDVTEDSYCYEPVLWAYYSGITSGTDPNLFSPDESCTRAQVVTFLWRLAGEPEPESSTSPFTDVTDPTSPTYDAIMWAVEAGITSGTSDTAFSPDDLVTRAQAVTFLWRYAGKPEPEATDSTFTDVSNTDAMFDPIMWAVESGITSGTSDTAFSPDDSCTRGQVVTFMYRYLGIS